MRYVYILESLDGEHFYVGITDDVLPRLAKHNARSATHLKIPTLARQDLRRIHQGKTCYRFREISEIRIRQGVREEAFLMG